MREQWIFDACIEALFRGGDKHLVEGGACLIARAAKALIVAHEVTGKGERKFVVSR